MTTRNLCAVYDFELLPYALGDVLTWNVQTALRCEERGRERVDVYVCADERFPASIYQRGLVTADNCGLFVNELYGAFGTHPRPGSLFLFRSRDDMLERLRDAARGDTENAAALADYERALTHRHDEAALIEYFTQTIHTHEQINAFAARHGRIPLLRPSLGCEPDVRGLVAARFSGKRLVTIHVRQRRLDAGYGGEHTYARDSDLLEWYEFLREAEKKHPDVVFVVMGRLQEKPLEFLRLPNVVSLRTFGLGLGHELTLMLKSDLFIGTSSGFAALANFSEIPYFITRMTPASCKAYRIDQGAERLPFATARQVLVYEPETREMLMRLLERGLADTPPKSSGPGACVDPAVDVRGWEWERAQWLGADATTYRFHVDDRYCDKETAFLLWPKVRDAQRAWRAGQLDIAAETLARIETSFPRVAARFPEFLALKACVAADRNDAHAAAACRAQLETLGAAERGGSGWLVRLRRLARRGYPLMLRLRDAWQRKHRIPRKLMQLVLRRGAA